MKLASRFKSEDTESFIKSISDMNLVDGVSEGPFSDVLCYMVFFILNKSIADFIFCKHFLIEICYNGNNKRLY